MLLLSLKPKMYAYYQIDENGENEFNVNENCFELYSKGIPLVRRDKIQLLKNLYKKILHMIMNFDTFKNAMCLLIDTLHDLLNDKISYKLLKSSRELNAHYKQPSFYMKVFADTLRQKNNIVNPGDRLKFLVVADPTLELLGQRMVLVKEYKESLTTTKPYKIDYLYYIEHTIMNPIDMIMGVGFKTTIDTLQDINYKPGRKRNPLTLRQPTEMLYYMIKNNLDIIQFKNSLVSRLN